MFVQLDELTGKGEEREWKETARWIKYEEDLEEGADRWGRPHVASLSFHSLLNLRRCLETGVVLLDLEEKDLPGVAYRVTEQMVTDELIKEADKPVIMRALLLRHKHVNDHQQSFAGRFVKRHNSSYSSLQVNEYCFYSHFACTFLVNTFCRNHRYSRYGWRTVLVVNSLSVSIDAVPIFLYRVSATLRSRKIKYNM